MHLSLLKYAAASNKAVYSRQNSLEYSSLFSTGTHLGYLPVNQIRLKAKTKVRKALTRDILFADDAVFAAHTQQDMQSMKNRFSQACKDFGLTIGLKKTNVMRQDARSPPATTIHNFKLDSVHLFTYLGSTSPWTLRSIRGSERRLQDTLASHFVCGQTPS